MKVIVSSGSSKLHFDETVRAAANAGVDVTFLTGWVPGESHRALVNALGSAFGEASLYNRMRSRVISGPRITTHSVAWAEFAGRALAVLNKANVAKGTTIASWQFELAAWASRGYLKDNDIFHVRSGAGRGGAIARARKNGLRIITDHSIAHPAYMKAVLDEEHARVGLPPEQFSEGGLWRIVLEDCADADRLLVNSDFVKRTFIEQGYSADIIDVAYLGVKETYFGLKQSYVSEGPFKILFTGSFSLRKGARTLIEALRLVRAGGVDARLQVIGKMENGSSCLLDSDAVFFTHTPFLPPEALLPALSAADIFAFPTLAEGCSRSAMEAAAAGLPVVTTENCGLPFTDGEAVAYVPLNDAPQLAETIAHLAASESLRQTLGRNAARAVEQHYTWSHYGRQLTRLYQQLLQNTAN